MLPEEMPAEGERQMTHRACRHEEVQVIMSPFGLFLLTWTYNLDAARRVNGLLLPAGVIGGFGFPLACR